MGTTALLLELWRHIDGLLHAMHLHNEAAHPLLRLYYHTADFHVEPGMDLLPALADALEVPRQHVPWALFGFAGHDFIQNGWLVERNGFLVRAYDPLNEYLTGLFMLRLMRGFKAHVTREERSIVLGGIHATTAKWDETLGTVRQPHHTPDLPLAARLIPLTDLCSVGIKPKKWLKEGLMLFREQQPGIVQRLREAKYEHELSTVEEDRIRTAFLAFLEMQAKFAVGRKVVHAEDTADFSARQKEKLAALFCQFDASATHAEARVARARNLSFKRLVRMFYAEAFLESE